jgi:glyoxylase-like metal-dependent hydrolase (beta-lactamase superfamily II)
MLEQTAAEVASHEKSRRKTSRSDPLTRLVQNKKRDDMSRYSIWVMEYAYIPGVAISSVIYGEHNKGLRKLPYGYVLIKGAGVLAMVDVGYNHATHGKAFGEKFGVEGWQPADVVLAEAGVKPEDVTHVFLTHGHFDHAGNLEAFPNAKVYIQQRELAKWVWAMALEKKFQWLNVATDPHDIMQLVDLARQGRLIAVDGDLEDAVPGIDLRAAHDTHTWGCQYVAIRNDGRRESEDVWVMAGDLVYTYENMRGTQEQPGKYIPVGLAMVSQENLLFATDAMIKTAGGDYKRVVPPHEEAVGTTFPSRVTKHGLRISEITLADGEKSLVN